MTRTVDQLQLATLRRTRSTERYTFDFVVNGSSLFELTQSSVFDMRGCLSDARFETDLANRFNATSLSTLTSEVSIGRGHRAVLFGCPECGDFACGAITVFVARQDDTSVQWSDFPYENGFEPAEKNVNLGPFTFDWSAYLAAFSHTQVAG
jgi:hypothetical protein